MSDVPVGVFLSGGIDSSAIAVLAAKHYGGRLQTFTAGFDFAGATDEMPQARALASELGTEHHELQVAGGDLAAVVEKLIAAHDQPFSDAANIPLFLLSEAVGSSVKVILQGDGGDEIFGGYRRYSQTAWSRSLGALSKGRRLIFGQGIRRDRALKMLDAFALRDPALRIAAITTQERLGRPLEVLAYGARLRVEASDPFARFREVVETLHHLGPVQQHLYADAQILLPDVFLEKVDKPTMAHSVEVRVPMLDGDLAAFAMALPGGYKVRGNHKKWILRQALRGIVPDRVLDAPKQGFGVPYAEWLRTSLRPWMEEVLFDPSFADWGVIDPDALRLVVDDHVNRKRNRGFFLYKMVNLALWKQRYGVTA
jgi:asparagine synthase (glutamine-hydrolysing)